MSAPLNRREAITRLALLMGGTIVGPRFLSGAWAAEAPLAAGDATAADLSLLDEIGDTIIPATNTPGAKAVHIGAFIAMMVRDCYEPEEQAAFRAGLRELPEKFHAKHGRGFVGAPAELRTAFLNELDREQRAHHAAKKKTDPEHYFRVMKELTILGYFSSEIGATQALRFVEVPGGLDGNVPYKKGDRAWFS